MLCSGGVALTTDRLADDQQAATEDERATGSPEAEGGDGATVKASSPGVPVPPVEPTVVPVPPAAAGTIEKKPVPVWPEVAPVAVRL